MRIRLKHVRSMLIIALTISAISALPKPAAAQGAWYAEFFANRDLGGAPVLTRYDEQLNFDWGGGSPGSGVPADNFSARWSRTIWFDAGTYRFSHRNDDGLRVWVDDTLVVNDWEDQQAAWSFVDEFIPQGTHTVTVEYYEHTGGARMQLAWERVVGGRAWRGEYYDTRDFEGSPTLVRYDAAIDFDWGNGSPDPSIPDDNFSVRWERTLGFEAGTYRFFASTDDGVRIFVDGQMVVDAWYDQKLPNTHSGDLTLSSGQHTVVVSYYEHGGEASVHAWWSRLGAFRGWEGRYYSNTELRGSPELIRDDPAINFDWGEGAPVSWMPADEFSVVWEQQVTFEPGTYQFNVRSDDGVRVWLDDGLVMDFWKPMDYEYHFVEGIDLEGAHTIKVEYFEQTGGARIRFWWERQGAAPTPAPTPRPPQVPPATVHRPGPWQGEYFDNPDLAGTPALTREDRFIDFDWGRGSPAPDLGRDNFSARWTGTFSFPAGRYCFTTVNDDGVRLYVGDQLIIDAWEPMHGTRTGCATLPAAAHTVRVEYFERTYVATIQVTVQQVSSDAEPAPAPAPQPDDRGPGEPWDAVYYDNAELAGEPVVARQEETLDFNWGWDSPAPAVPSDNFSAVWTRQVDLSGGRYLFSTYSDDGVRLLIDGERVIDSWQPMRGYRNAVVTLSEGIHTVELQYFERRGIALARLDWRPQ